MTKYVLELTNEEFDSVINALIDGLNTEDSATDVNPIPAVSILEALRSCDQRAYQAALNAESMRHSL